MAQRVVGGGERFVRKELVSFSGSVAVVKVPPGADAARIQPQLWTNGLASVLVNRGAEATLAANEIALESREVLMDAFSAGCLIYLRLVDVFGEDQAEGEADQAVVCFYTNVAGRATKVGI